jgi:hypothetical protein
MCPPEVPDMFGLSQLIIGTDILILDADNIRTVGHCSGLEVLVR